MARTSLYKENEPKSQYFTEEVHKTFFMVGHNIEMSARQCTIFTDFLSVVLEVNLRKPRNTPVLNRLLIKTISAYVSILTIIVDCLPWHNSSREAKSPSSMKRRLWFALF